jgi:hypothetical protein
MKQSTNSLPISKAVFGGVWRISRRHHPGKWHFVVQVDGTLPIGIDEMSTSPVACPITDADRCSAARAAVLFSGGVDSTFLAYMLHRVLPASEPIDLINIAFQRDPSLATPLASRPASSSSTPLLSTPVAPQTPSSSATPTPTPAEEGVDEVDVEGEPRPPNGLSAADHARLEKENGEYAVPDRIGGREALDELKRTCEREWRFVEVDVPFDVSGPDDDLRRPSLRG